MTEQRYSREDHEAYRRKVEAEAEREAQERRERSEKHAAYRSWIQGGGNPAAFEREWPAIKADRLKRRIGDADDRARESQRASRVSRI
jgi:hypothetical protein